MNAQQSPNFALIFDGDNDHANVPSFVSTLPEEGFSFEAQVKIDSLEDHFATILSAVYLDDDENKLHFSFGINGGTLKLAVEVNNTVYEQQDGNVVELNECVWVAVTFLPDEIQFYINGNLESTIAGPAPSIDRINQYMIGNALSSSYFGPFQGQIDEVRGWLIPIDGAIIQNHMHPLPAPVHDMHLHVNFHQGQGQVITNLWHTMPGYLGAQVSIDGADPSWVINDCFEEEGPSVDRIGNIALNCPEDSAPCELVCNGTFEVFDSILFTPLGWPYHFPALVPDQFFNSDVAGWYANKSAEFFFRGAPTQPYGYDFGIPTNFATWFYGPIHNPPVETRTGQSLGNNGYAGMHTSLMPEYYFYAPVELINKLKEPLINNSYYDLNFWTFTYPILGLSLNTALKVHIQSGDNPAIRHFIGVFDQVNSTYITTNNGWHPTNTSFQVPNNGITYDRLVIEPSNVFESNLQTWIAEGWTNYTFIDDVSLQKSSCCHADFSPKLVEYIQPTGSCCSDIHATAVEVNYEGDLFAAVFYSDPDTVRVEGELNYHLPTRPNGTSYQKYCADGSLSWTKLLDGLAIEDIATDKLGNSYIAGYYTQTYTGTLSNSTPVTLTHSGGQDAFVAKIDANGGIEWITRFIESTVDVVAKKILFKHDQTYLIFALQTSAAGNVAFYNSDNSFNAPLNPIQNVALVEYSFPGFYHGHTVFNDLNVSDLQQTTHSSNNLYMFGTSNNHDIAHIRVINPNNLSSLSTYPITQNLFLPNYRMNKSLVVDGNGDCFISLAFEDDIDFNATHNLIHDPTSSCVAIARLNLNGNDLAFDWAQAFSYPGVQHCFGNFLENGKKYPLSIKNESLYLGVTEENACDFGNGVTFNTPMQTLLVKFAYNGVADWLVESSGNTSHMKHLSANGPFPGIFAVGDIYATPVSFGNHTFSGTGISAKTFLVRITEDVNGGAYHRQAKTGNWAKEIAATELAQLTLYPNPTHDILFVQGAKVAAASYVIHDIQGRVLQKGTYNPNEGIAVQSLSQGVYIIRLANQYPMRFIKQ
ncbi:MAG: LamG-like jellyroll fold domain-containing protein [Bacteroidia bacterium]